MQKVRYVFKMEINMIGKRKRIKILPMKVSSKFKYIDVVIQDGMSMPLQEMS
jgi:hypothetical protein